MSGKSKKKIPSLGKREYTGWGYTEPEHLDSDLEDGEEALAKPASGEKVVVHRVYILPKPEFVLLVTSSICVFVTALLWLPWVIERFELNYRPTDNFISGDFSKFAVICMNLAPLVKFVVYLAANQYFRSACLKTFVEIKEMLKRVLLKCGIIHDR